MEPAPVSRKAVPFSRKIYRGLRLYEPPPQLDQEGLSEAEKQILSRSLAHDEVFSGRIQKGYSGNQTPTLTKVIQEGKLHVLKIDHFLSDEETRHYLNEAKLAGFTSLEKEYPTEYRSGSRVLADARELTQRLYERLIPLLTKNGCHTALVGQRPLGFGTEGTWTPCSLNPCLRFTRYRSGDHFAPHVDGMFSESENRRSVFTLLIYLNHGEGNTVFFPPGNKEIRELYTLSPTLWLPGFLETFNHTEEQAAGLAKLLAKLDSYPQPTVYLFLDQLFLGRSVYNYSVLRIGREMYQEYPHVHQTMVALVRKFEHVSCRIGRAVLFNHEVLHAGEMLRDMNEKYIMKTELVFERIPNFENSRMNATELVSYQRMNELYERAESLENDGDLVESLRFYLEAQQMQLEAGRVTSSASGPRGGKSDATSPQLVTDVLHLVFKQIPKFSQVWLVCSEWYEAWKDPALWRYFYRLNWESVELLESSCKKSEPAYLRDWYNLYRLQRNLGENEFLVLDFGQCNVKFGRVSSGVSSVMNVVGIEISHHYVHSRNSILNEISVSDDDILEIALPFFSRVYQNGHMVRVPEEIEELWLVKEDSLPLSFLYHIFRLSNTVSSVTPVVLPMNLSLYAEDMYLDMKRILLGYFKVPKVLLFDETLLTVLNTASITGIVVKCGDHSTSVSVVTNGEVARRMSLNFRGVDATFLFYQTFAQDNSISSVEEFLSQDSSRVRQYRKMTRRRAPRDALSQTEYQRNVVEAYMSSPSEENPQCKGLAELVMECIKDCAPALRNHLLRHIVLEGREWDDSIYLREEFELTLTELCEADHISPKLFYDSPASAVVDGGKILSRLSIFTNGSGVTDTASLVSALEEQYPSMSPSDLLPSVSD